MSKDELPASVLAYKPQILKIKLGPFRNWIERKLTDLLEGMEDEILWGLVFNYLEDAQKRAKREGPAANPSGGLNAREIQTALSGFLGPKQARDFITELFTLLEKAEASDSGVPEEFKMKPEEAEKEVDGIIQSKRKEMDLSDRVKREVIRNDYHNRRDYDDSRRGSNREYTDRRDDHRRDSRRERESSDRRDDHRDREVRDSRNDRDYRRSREYSDRSRSRSRSRDRSRHYEHHRDRYHDSRDSRDSRDYERDREREREHERERDRDYERERDRGFSRHRDNNDRDSEYRYRPSDSKSRRKSPIPSSSPDSPSPCWETTMEIIQGSAAKAPVVEEHVPTELELALKARALKSVKKE